MRITRYHIDGLVLTIIQHEGELLKTMCYLIVVYSVLDNEENPLEYLTYNKGENRWESR